MNKATFANNSCVIYLILGPHTLAQCEGDLQ